MNFIIKIMNDSNPLIRCSVACALATIGNAESVMLLVRLYEDKDDVVKRESLKYLIKVNEEINLEKISVPATLKAEIDKIINSGG